MISIYISKCSSSSVVHTRRRTRGPHTHTHAFHSLKHSATPARSLPATSPARHATHYCSAFAEASHVQHNFSVRLADETRYMNAPTCRLPYPYPLPAIPVHPPCARACACVRVCWACVALWAWSRLNKLHLSAKVLRTAWHASPTSACFRVGITGHAPSPSPLPLAFIIITRCVEVKTCSSVRSLINNDLAMSHTHFSNMAYNKSQRNLQIVGQHLTHSFLTVNSSLTPPFDGQ